MGILVDLKELRWGTGLSPGVTETKGTSLRVSETGVLVVCFRVTVWLGCLVWEAQLGVQCSV